MAKNSADSESFNENYKILKETSEWLTKEEDPDIDGLIPKIERAMQAYKICKIRIEKAKLALAEYVSDSDFQNPDKNHIDTIGKNGIGNDEK